MTERSNHTDRRRFAGLAGVVPVALAFALASAAPTAASDADSKLVAALDALAQARYAPDKPGAAVLVARGGRVVLRKAYGLADLELGVPMRPDMVFRLGSVTKQFTAVAVLMLAADGKLALADPITKHLPDYPTHGRSITVEHLLTHTSGIPSYTGLPEWLPLWRKDLPLSELIGLFKDKDLEFEPGTRWKYDNSGYVLLGAIIERVSGQSYDQFVQQRIFEPLGMKDSSYGSTSRIVPRRVPGYSRADKGYQNAAYLSMTQPFAAGALLSTVDDLLRWDQALGAGRLLPAASLQKAWTPYALADGKTTGYGYGWAIADFEGHRLITHGGGINGFVTSAFRVPDAGLYVAVLSNDEGSDPGGLAIRLVALALGKPVAKPKAVSLPEADLVPLVGVYGSDIESKRFITRDGARLFSQRSGGERYQIFALSDTEFFFEDGDSRLRFRKDGSGRVTGVQVRALVDYGPSEVAERTNEPLPSMRRAISVDPAVLDRHLGEYEVAPGITMTVTREGSGLVAQMTGQEKIAVLAESETLFFLEKIDAQIEFIRNAEGRTTSLVILQAGQKLPAARLK